MSSADRIANDTTRRSVCLLFACYAIGQRSLRGRYIRWNVATCRRRPKFEIVFFRLVTNGAELERPPAAEWMSAFPRTCLLPSPRV